MALFGNCCNNLAFLHAYMMALPVWLRLLGSGAAEAQLQYHLEGKTLFRHQFWSPKDPIIIPAEPGVEKLVCELLHIHYL